MRSDSVVLAGTSFDIPDTIKSLGHDNLHIVPFDLILAADEEIQGDDFHWVNPRHYEKGIAEDFIPQGFADDEMQALLNDIREDGLIYSIVCRWFAIDNKLYVQILDGERRWRCIRKLISENQMCWDKNQKKMRPAKDVYKTVPCGVYLVNDKESFKIAYQATNRQVKWGDGANARSIKHLRASGCSDEEILELTKKTGQWLREEDKLCTLDKETFAYYASGKNNRSVALLLCGVADVEVRLDYAKKTYEQAQEDDDKRLAKLDADINRLEEKEELAEAKLAEATILGTPEEVEEREAELAEAQEKVKDAKKQRARGSQGKTKQLRKVVNAAQQNGSSAPPPPESLKQALRPGKIKKQLELLEKIQEQDGNFEDEPLIPLISLGYLVAAYNAILNGDENIVKAIRRQTKVNAQLEERRAKLIA
jgi:hypothetical protein